MLLHATQGEEDKPTPKLKHRQVTNILKWVQCFNIYIAVISAKSPSRVRDLLSYQTLIIQASMEYKGDGWLGYDRRFRQNVAADPDLVWVCLDPTFWNIAFAGQGSTTCCSYCFSLTHLSAECEWAQPAPKAAPMLSTSPYIPLSAPRQTNSPLQPISYNWNYSHSPVCLHPNYKYQHLCVHCYNDPTVANKVHKAIFYPRRPRPVSHQANSQLQRAGRPRFQSGCCQALPHVWCCVGLITFYTV